MTTINDDKIRDWKGVLPSITHTKEHQLSIALNTHFLNRKLGLYCKRIECENAPFSDQDIEVYEYDMETLVRGRTIIKIDAENKPNRIFSGKREIPSGWPRGISFTSRKVSKDSNNDQDVYLLHDCNIEKPGVIWAPYGWIRKYGEFQRSENGNRLNNFYAIKDTTRVEFGISRFCDYCEEILNGGDEISFYSDGKHKSIFDF